MAHLFHRSSLIFELITVPNATVYDGNGCFCHCIACHVRTGDRCRLNDVFDLQYPEKWLSAHSFQGTTDQYLFAGPVDYGSANSYCSDCSGCNTNF